MLEVCLFFSWKRLGEPRENKAAFLAFLFFIFIKQILVTQISSTTQRQRTSFIHHLAQYQIINLKFHIQYEIDEKAQSKSCNYTSSQTLEELFVQMDVCPRCLN